MQPSRSTTLLQRGEMDYALGPLRAKFAGDLVAQAESIDALMMVAETGSSPAWPLHKLQEITHRLAGVAAILGFPQVGDLAQRCELAIAAEIAGGPKPGCLAEIGDLLDDLVVEMERHATWTPAPGFQPRDA